MTLVLTARTPDFVVQASDRMVSLRGDPPTPHDPESNKSLIYIAEDGILTLSYTGVAYIVRKTTDHWLAETMRGRELPQDHCMYLDGAVPEWRKLNAALRSIGESLDKAYKTDLPPMARRETMTIAVAGWSFNSRKRQARTFACHLYKRGADSSSELKYRRSERRWIGGDLMAQEQLTACGSGAHVIDEQRLRPYFAAPDAPAKAKALAKVIEEVSQMDSSVSPDSLVVILMPPGRGGSGVAYYTQHYKTPKDKPPIFYSPWILSQGCSMGPSRIWGPPINIGGWKFGMPLNPTHYDGGGPSILMSAQRRPPPP